MITGRLPAAAGRGPAAVSTVVPAPEGGVRPKSLPALATALPASEVRKNLRRVHNSIGVPSRMCGRNYTVESEGLKVESAKCKA
jgi:hypothetical protein